MNMNGTTEVIVFCECMECGFTWNQEPEKSDPYKCPRRECLSLDVYVGDE